MRDLWIVAFVAGTLTSLGVVSVYAYLRDPEPSPTDYQVIVCEHACSVELRCPGERPCEIRVRDAGRVIGIE